MLIIKAYPPHVETKQKQASEAIALQNKDPLLTDFKNKQKLNTKAKIATASLSYDPATDLEMQEGTREMNKAEKSPASECFVTYLVNA